MVGWGPVRRFSVLVVVGVATVSLLTSLGYGPRLFGFVNRVPGRDQTAHFVLVTLLCFSVNLGFPRARLRGRALGVLGMSAAVLVGVALEELSQILIPTRALQAVDLAANVAGVAVGGGLAALVLWLRPPPETASPFESEETP